ncbi:N-acetyltransferase [Dryocola sp. BD626]|uniref:N-acetyltransferase n=1 Tax=Dryocola sp. BD626 TaxID=3133273 RepID=UPI003F4FCC03
MEVISATAKDNASLLQLLEENAMSGNIDLVLTRRPDFFSLQHNFGEEHPVIALEGSRAVGMCQLTKHAGFANGEPQPLGYLGSLRVTPCYRHRIRVLKAGFDFLHQFSPPEHCYTSIAADNSAARRLLERGVAGLPGYQPLGEMLTLAMNRKRGKHHGLWRILPEDAYPKVVDFYNRIAASRQLAPRLSVQWLHLSGVPVLGFSDAQGMRACAVLWNQQAFKQVIAMRYSPCLHALRPLWNAYAALKGLMPLPKIGQPLDQSFLAFFACDDNEKMSFLIEDALTLCTTRVMTLGLPAEDASTTELIARTRPMIYRTCLYGVNLTSHPVWDTRPVWPEVALL